MGSILRSINAWALIAAGILFVTFFALILKDVLRDLRLLENVEDEGAGGISDSSKTQ